MKKKLSILPVILLLSASLLLVSPIDVAAAAGPRPKYEEFSIHSLCLKGNLDLVKALVGLPYCISVNIEDSGGKLEVVTDTNGYTTLKNAIQTPLHCAVEGGHIEIVEYLLDKNANINSKHHEYGSTPLYLAAWFNHPECLKLLIERGAYINEPNLYAGSSPVHGAAWRNNPECLKILIDNGADFTQRNTTGEGNTPLYLSAKSGSPDCLKILLERDSNKLERVKMTSSGNHTTPLEVALFQGRADCCLPLMRAGARLGDYCLDKGSFAEKLYTLLKAIEASEKEITLSDEHVFDQYSGSCGLCTRDYKTNDMACFLPCNDSFHFSCIQRADLDAFTARNPSLKPIEEYTFNVKTYGTFFACLKKCPKCKIDCSNVDKWTLKTCN